MAVIRPEFVRLAVSWSAPVSMPQAEAALPPVAVAELEMVPLLVIVDVPDRVPLTSMPQAPAQALPVVVALAVRVPELLMLESERPWPPKMA